MRFPILSALCLALIATASCAKGGPDTPGGGLTLTPYYLLNEGDDMPASHAGRTGASVLTPVAGTYARTKRAATQMDMPVYPRFIKTVDGQYLMFYHCGIYDTSSSSSQWAGDFCAYSRSSDGVNWTFEKNIFPVQKNVQGHYDNTITRYYAGPHPVRLADGRILVVASYRGSEDMRHHLLDNGLAIKFSSDEGATWTQEVRINVGTNWEPRPIVLREDSDYPGRVIIYYTDSYPYIDKGDVAGWPNAVVSSGVSYIYSDDNGATWKPTDALNDHLHAYRQFRDQATDKNGQMRYVYTDQMPGVIQLVGSKQLVGCGEANQNPCSKTTTDYWVNLAYSDNNGEWSGNVPEGADFPSDRQNKVFKGAAPTIEQFVSGETVLTYNGYYTQTDTRNFFYFHLGDENARSFGERNAMFKGASPIGFGFWGSVLCDGHVLLAGIGGTGGNRGLKYPLQTGKLYLNHDIDASSHSVVVDGNNSDWKKTDQALFLSSEEPWQLVTLRCAEDAANLYFLAEIDAADGVQANSFVSVYLTDPSASGLAANDVWVKVLNDGKTRTSVYKQGGWYTSDPGFTCKVNFAETCYLAEFSIKKSDMPIKDGSVGVNLAINSETEGTIYIKPLANNTIRINLNK